MSNMLTPYQAADWLKARDDFLIITHRRPDGDTVGSAGGLAQGLREIRKTAYVLYNPETTPRYLQFVEDYCAPDDYVPKNIIAVDIASVDLLTKNAAKYEDAVTLCIDHHKSNTLYAQFACLEAERASCGEIIFDILMAITGTVSSLTADCLYVALSTDTGCFCFANTTANTLFVASMLVEAGASHKILNKQLFRTKTRSRIKIENMLVSGLEFSFDNKVCIAAITREMMETSGAHEDDVDDVAAIPGSIEGVKIGITIREMTSANDCKISVRTTPPYNAQTICERFGGGGHRLAAGSSIKNTVDGIKEMLRETLVDFVPWDR